MMFFSLSLPPVNASDRLAAPTEERATVPATTHHLFREQTAGKRKRERTRSALLDSAISVFAAKGFEGASIVDITNHADMANGTFYNYYQDKNELLRDVTIGLAAEFTRQINEEMSHLEHGPTRVALATARILEIARHEPEWLSVFVQGVFVVTELQSATIQYLKQDLEIGTSQGHFTVEVNLLLINQVLSLIRVALLLDPDMSDGTIRQTCAATLRLLGMTPRRAEQQVTRVFTKFLSSSTEPVG